MSLSPLGTRWPGQNHKGIIILQNNALKPYSTEAYVDGIIECFSNWKIRGMRNHWYYVQHLVKSQAKVQVSDGKDAIPAIPDDPKWASHPEKGLTGVLKALGIDMCNRS